MLVKEVFDFVKKMPNINEVKDEEKVISGVGSLQAPKNAGRGVSMEMQWQNKDRNDDQLKTIYRLSRDFLLKADNPIKVRADGRNFIVGAPAVEINISPSFYRNEKKDSNDKYSDNKKMMEIIYNRYKHHLNKEEYPFIKINYEPFGKYLESLGYKKVPNNNNLYGNEHAIVDPKYMPYNYDQIKSSDLKPYAGPGTGGYRSFQSDIEKRMTQSKYRNEKIKSSIPKKSSSKSSSSGSYSRDKMRGEKREPIKGDGIARIPSRSKFVKR